MENLSPQEQKSLSQLYMFLTQNPKHGITVRSWADVQLLWTQYQTLIWRPAELLNGAQPPFSLTVLRIQRHMHVRSTPHGIVLAGEAFCVT